MVSMANGAGSCRVKNCGGGGATRRGIKAGFGFLGLVLGFASVLAPLWLWGAAAGHDDGGAHPARSKASSPFRGRNGDDDDSNDHPTLPESILRATLRRESLQDAPSCVHTFGQLELINVHLTDSIVIHSIRTVQETTTVPASSYLTSNQRGAAAAAAAAAAANVTYGCWEDYRVSGNDNADDDVDNGAWSHRSVGGGWTESDPGGAASSASSSSSFRLPRQFQVSNLPTSSFVLGANQIAIVPVSFLPRFPPDPSGSCRKGGGSDYDVDDDDPPPAAPRHHHVVPSEAQRRDLQLWLGSKRRSNRFSNLAEILCPRPDTYVVTATVVIESSVGVLHVPIDASSHPYNDYGLPDRITFSPPSPPPPLSSSAAAAKSPSAAPTLSAPVVHNSWTGTSGRGGAQPTRAPLPYASDGTDRRAAIDDCYDLYIQNPASSSWTASDGTRYDDGPFTVLAVTVSMPDRVTVAFSSPSSPAADSSVATVGDDFDSSSSDGLPQQHDWQTRDEYGGFVGGGVGGIDIPADGRSHYVASLCPNRNFSHPSSYDDYDEPGDDESADDQDRDVGTVMVSPAEAESWMGFVNILTSHDSLFISLERHGEGPAKFDKEAFLVDPNAPASHLRVSPAAIDAQLVSSSGSKVSIPLDISSVRTRDAIVIMRASVVYDLPKDLQDLNFTVNIRGDALSEAVLIDPNETVKGGLTFECSVDWGRFVDLASRQSVEFSGTVLIRGSTSEGYDRWEAQMKADPSVGSQLVVDVPFRVNLINGEVAIVIQSTSHPDGIFWSYRAWGGALAVSAAFFPASQEGVRASLSVHQDEAFYQMERMNHQLRVFSNVGAATQIRSVEVRPTKESANPATTSMCNYFDVSVLKDHDDDRYDGVVDWNNAGLIELVYRFPTTNMSSTETQASNFPVMCYLHLNTEPDTGSHVMPLVIYTGHVDLSVSQSGQDSDRLNGVGGSIEDENSAWHRTLVGFEKVLSWLLRTKAGESFRAILQSASKKSDGNYASFERYLRGISLDLVNEKVRPFLRPVLVQAGAINHGETETIPLYMTNSNPVPIEAWIDVGEVEGMSIALGRDKSSGRGDGNNILDYLPSASHSLYAEEGDEPRVRGGNLRGHPVKGLRQFLMQDDFVASFLSEFPYRAAISLSAAAVARLPMVQYLFMTFSLAEFYRRPLPLRFEPDSWSRCDKAVHPPHYGSFERRLATKMMPGPIIISSDGCSVRNLPVCWDRKGEPAGKRRSEDTSIHIPPGATARFDITLRAPPQPVLKKDITQFLSTGLVLSTNHGEVMPIFVSFEALQGRFDVSHVKSPNTAMLCRDGVIRVPMKLFDPPPQDNTTFNIKIPPRSSRPSSAGAAGEIIKHNVTTSTDRISLYMRSTFARDVRLRQVISCNPWFSFEPAVSQTPKIDPIRGIEIGSITSSVTCGNPVGLLENVTWNPSYFLCLLNWMMNRTDIQPSGCGVVSAQENSPGKDSSHRTEVRGVDRAVRAMKRALVVSQFEHGSFRGSDMTSSSAFKLRHRESDGTSSKAIVGAIAEAWDAWRALSEYGFRTTATSMRAIIDYNSTDGDALPLLTQVLSVAMRNLTIESVFKSPKIFDASTASLQYPEAAAGTDENPGMMKFPDTLVAGVSYAYVPLRNPTSVPVKVRLTVAGAESTEHFHSSLDSVAKVDESVKHRFLQRMMSPFVQSRENPEKSHQGMNFPNDWWGESGGYYQADFDGDIIRSRHNVSITYGPQAVLSLHNPSLLSSISFLTGCGPRCGVKDDPFMSEQVQTPTMGCGSALGSSIVGAHRRFKHRDRIYSSSPSGMSPSGMSPLAGSTGPSAFALPYASMDEIIIPPHGEAELGPILFRPPGRFSTVGCRAQLKAGKNIDCESEEFQALLLLENTLTGLERVVLKGEGKVQSVDFVDPTEAADSFGSIEIRNGLPTLFFTGPFNKARPSAKEVVLWNSGDVPVFVTSVFISASHETRSSAPTHDSMSPCEFGGFTLRECAALNAGFHLDPGRNRSIVVEHRQQCTLRTDVASLGVVFEQRDLQQADERIPASREGSLTNHLSHSGRSRYERANAAVESNTLRKAFLMLSYDMSRADFSACKPIKMSPVQLYRTAPQNVTSGKSKGTPRGSRYRTWWNFTLSSSFLLSALTAMNVLSKRWLQRKSASTDFHSALPSARRARGFRWRADFWYLARVDPPSQDLQSLCRERVRNVTLSRYRSSGALVPSCINGSGGFQREKLRPGALAAVNNGIGPERNKTLSDALFRHFVPPEQGIGRLPCDLSWRTAYSRGLLNETSFLEAVAATKTNILISQRRDARPDDEESSQTQSDEEFSFSDSESESSETSSSEFSSIEVPDLGSSSSPRQQVGSDRVATEKARGPFELTHNSGNGHVLPPEKPAHVDSLPVEVESGGRADARLNASEHSRRSDQNGAASLSPSSVKSPAPNVVPTAGTSRARPNQRTTESTRPDSGNRNAKSANVAADDLKEARSDDSNKPVFERKKRVKQPKPDRSFAKSVRSKGAPRGKAAAPASATPAVRSSKPQEEAWGPKPEPPGAPSLAGSPFRPPPGLPPPPGFSASSARVASPSTPARLSPPSRDVLGSPTTTPARHPVGTTHSPVIARPALPAPRTSSRDRLDLASAHSPILPPPISSPSGNAPSASHLSGSALSDPFALYAPPGAGATTTGAVRGSHLSPLLHHPQASSSATQGFDIMDFLDGVLNEGGSGSGALLTWDDLAYDAAPASSTVLQSALSGGGTASEEEEEEDGDDGEEDDDPPNPILNDSISGLLPLVSANPWASVSMSSEPALPILPPAASSDSLATAAAAATERQSRLSALYGISIEDVSERTAAAAPAGGGGTGTGLLAADVVDGSDLLLVDLFPVTTVAEEAAAHGPSLSVPPPLRGEGESLSVAEASEKDPEVSFLSDAFG